MSRISTIKVGDLDVDVDSASKSARALIERIKFLDAEILQRQNEYQVTLTAKETYKLSLRGDIG